MLLFEENISGKCKPIEYEVNENGCHVVNSHKEHSKSGHIKIFRNGKHVFIHRYVFELVNRVIPKGNVVRHTCDNPKCINPDHLIIGTIEDNVKDRATRNRSASQKGEDNGSSKLSNTEVKEIKLLLNESNMTMTDIARKYNVSRTLIGYIKREKLWSHVS